MNLKNFTPLVFLASLGAGGVAIMPFILMQNSIKEGLGLITRTELWAKGLTGFTAGYYYSLEAIMIIFTILHFVLTILFTIKLVKWMKTKDFGELIQDPLKNASILVPLISILMTLNIFIGPIRYFFPLFSDNFQSLFLPATIFWSMLFVFILYVEIYLLGISFKKGFNIDKINFGWLLHPFLLGMLSVVGSGIAAMTQNIEIANPVAFMTMISAMMGSFLLVVKMIVIFKSHFAAKSLPGNQFLPSFLIVIPNITLFSLTFFRLGHFLQHHHGFDMGAYFYLIVGLSFAFEIWYMLFGISLLINYFKVHHFKEFYITQWGFICPLVAFVTLGSFAYKLILKSDIFYGILVIIIGITVWFFIDLLIKHLKCLKSNKYKIHCEI